MRKISLEINGKKIKKEIPDHTTLSGLLRDILNLTGTHIGCDTSQCGACVVHVDGKSIKSCTALAADLDGSKITTIEGLVSKVLDNNPEIVERIRSGEDKLISYLVGEVMKQSSSSLNPGIVKEIIVNKTIK